MMISSLSLLLFILCHSLLLSSCRGAHLFHVMMMDQQQDQQQKKQHFYHDHHDHHYRDHDPNTKTTTTTTTLTSTATTVAKKNHSLSSVTSTTNSDRHHPICRTYLATSTIPHAGLGMFYGGGASSDDYRPITKNGITLTTPDIMVPIIDVSWHHPDEKRSSFLWKDYIWSGYDFPFQRIIPFHDQIDVASFGMGAISNCLLPLLNMRDNTIIAISSGSSSTSSTSSSSSSHGHPPPRRDDQHYYHAATSAADASIGSYTPYHHRQAISSYISSTNPHTYIRPGDELFIDYGQEYFLERPRSYGNVPLPSTYRTADAIIEDLLWLLPGEERHRRGDGDRRRSDLYQLIREVSRIWENNRLYTALPKYYGDMADMMATYPSTKYTHRERSHRSLDELQRDGACMDYVEVRDSFITTGRGLFAVKEFVTNEIIAPMPLIHIPNRTILTMYDGYYVPIGHNNHRDHHKPLSYVRNTSAPYHTQLLINYCYGHADSTLLLCPYGIGTSLVNHDSVHPNARVIWSTKFNRRMEWLNQPLEQWGTTKSARLAFDLIATRSILPDEEITIDYGIDWQMAWDYHIAHFDRHHHYHPSYRLKYHDDDDNDSGNRRRRYDVTLPLHHEPWPWKDVHLWCRIDGDDEHPAITSQHLFRSFRTKKKNSNDYASTHLYDDPYHLRNPDSSAVLSSHRPCTILSKIPQKKKKKEYHHDDEEEAHDNPSYYTVQFHTIYHDLPTYPTNDDDDDDDDDLMEYHRIFGDDAYIDTCMIVSNHKRWGRHTNHLHDDAMIGFMIPYDYILFGNAYTPFVEYYYTNEPWTFRHDIRIPDDIFPDVWKNNIPQR